MICHNCRAEVQDFPFCPYCGHRLKDEAEYSPQEPSKHVGRRRFFRRWLLPFFLLLVVICFGILGLALTGFVDGMADRGLATQHQAEIQYYQGLIYLERGQYQLAEAAFEEALRLLPAYTEAEQQHRIAQAKQTVTPSPTPEPTPAPTLTPVIPTPTTEVVVIPVTQALFEQAQTHYQQQEWSKVISLLEQLRSEDLIYRSEEVAEMLFRSHKSYGLELEEQGSLEEAISHYDSALYLRRRDPETEELRQRADLYMKALGVWNVDWDRVIVNLTALYALAPDYKDIADRLYQATTTQAQVLIKAERYCPAAELLEQAIEIHNDDPAIAKLEDDARHLCRITTPMPLETPTPNGSAHGHVHLGTMVASCYDHRTNQYDLCAQTAQDNVLRTWITQAEQPALPLDGTALAYRSTDPERPGLYVIRLVSDGAVKSDTAGGTASVTSMPTAIATRIATATPIVARTATVTSTATIAGHVVTAGEVVTITVEETAGYPTWSPDGTRIAYTQYDPEAEDWFVYVALVDSLEAPRRIHQGEWPNWGPNGLLAFTTCSDENTCGIHVFDPRSWEMRPVTNSIQDRAAAWSPSGDEIAYMSDVGRSFNIYVAYLSPPDVTVRQITRNLVKDGMPAWSPDGQRIAYVTNRDDDWAIYTLHPYGDQEERVATLGAESADWLRFQLSWVAPVISFSPRP